jgi:hypothetical protein
LSSLIWDQRLSLASRVPAQAIKEHLPTFLSNVEIESRKVLDCRSNCGNVGFPKLQDAESRAASTSQARGRVDFYLAVLREGQQTPLEITFKQVRNRKHLFPDKRIIHKFLERGSHSGRDFSKKRDDPGRRSSLCAYSAWNVQLC